jgi:hypothetical protein
MNTTISVSDKAQPKVMLKKVLLSCGILSSIYYIALNIYIPSLFEGYSINSQTVSELSAIGAPTRQLWVQLCIMYSLLFGAFGIGVIKSAGENKRLRIAGRLILGYTLFNVFWPPMHLRGNQPTLTDALHIVWAMITLMLMMVIMGYGAAALGKRFRWYTAITWIVFIVFGVLTFKVAPGIANNEPTPWIGIWERINMGAFLLWVMVFAIVILQKAKLHDNADTVRG